ncbi:MAG: hypothetical protein AAFW82_10790, partial [Pseudomonadota bacterium]
MIVEAQEPYAPTDMHITLPFISMCRRFGIHVAITVLWAFGIAALVSANASDAAPRRVVSMNLCTDQLAMLLAAPGQLYSVSYLAGRTDASVLADRA